MKTSDIREDSETDESMYDWIQEETEHSTLSDDDTRRSTRLSMLRQEILHYRLSKDVGIPERDEISTAEYSAMAKLVETNRYLSTKFVQLTREYAELVDKYNETVEGFRFELGLLRAKLDEIETARMLTVEVPDSWISEEMLEGDSE